MYEIPIRSRTEKLGNTMSVITVSEVVKAFCSSFKSIDLKTVAVRPENQWVNLITSIFLSSKAPEEIDAKQEKLIKKLPEKTDKFGFFLSCYDIKKLSYLFGQISKGKIPTTRISIKFQDITAIKCREINPYELKAVNYIPSHLKENEEWRLIGAEAKGQVEDRRNLWSIAENQDRAVRLLNFKDIYELIEETLGIRDFARGNDMDFIIGIPMPARIVGASLSDSSVKVKSKKAFNLKDLQLNLTVQGVRLGGGFYETASRYTKSVSRARAELKSLPGYKFCFVTDSIQVNNLMPHDLIDVKLIHKLIPTLNLDERRLTAPLKNAVEPFAKALASFCSLEDFKKRLLNPEQIRRGRMKTSEIFENAVAWLLSLVGFSVVQLKDFESLRVPETKYERGSIDMIAYRENECLLLVDCDTSIPESKKIGSMIAVKNYFGFIQDEHGCPRIFSVIFSPRDCSEISVGRQAIKIVDKHQIMGIFEDVMKGNQEQARLSLVY